MREDVFAKGRVPGYVLRTGMNVLLVAVCAAWLFFYFLLTVFMVR